MPGGANHLFGFHVPQSLDEAGMDSVKVVGGRGQHKLAYQLWVPNGDLQGDTGSHAMAEEVVIFDAELPECGSGIAGHLLEAQRSALAGALRFAPRAASAER